MLPLDQTCGFGCRTLLINIRIVSCSFLQVNKTQDADRLIVGQQLFWKKWHNYQL